ncbi:MAG: AgmX/PglI C-terminal domain-containing protein [Kofleriaceae bacterium]
MRWIVLVGVLAACGGKKDDAGGGGAKAKHGALKVALGDCGPPGTTFVSGPPSKIGQTLALEPSEQPVAPDAAHPNGAFEALAGEDRPKSTSVGQPAVNGDLDKAVIRRYVKRNIQKIQYCYEKELLANDKLQGTVTTSFFIDPEGKVTSATGSGVDPHVAECVAGVIKSIEFPKPKGGGVQVNYPFTFHQAGSPGSKTPPTPPAKAPPPPPPPAPAPAEESGGTGTAMALDDGAMGKIDRPYVEKSPLLSRVPALEDCATAQSLAYGTFAVEWKSATDVAVIGVDDPRFAACISDAAKQASFDKPMRCSAAFGVIAEPDRHAIVVDDKDVKLDGNVVDHVAAIDKTSSALGDSLDRKLPKASAGTVAVRGPVWLRANGKTPMKAVNAIFRTAASDGVDLVLVDANGKPLVEVAPPVAPVDATKAGSWTGLVRVKGPDSTEQVVGTITLSKDNLWFGISRVNEFSEADGRDWSKFESMLKDAKASAFFSDRPDIEIGADDDVSYGDVLHAIDLAKKIGFTQWKVYIPEALTARPTL